MEPKSFKFTNAGYGRVNDIVYCRMTLVSSAELKRQYIVLEQKGEGLLTEFSLQDRGFTSEQEIGSLRARGIEE
jgi:hypothetical protein